MPATWTITGPVVAPDGTIAVIAVSLQEVIAAVDPLKLALLLLWAEPKPAPVIVTDVPIGPTDGVIVVTASGSITVNCSLLLVTPFIVRVTGPLCARLLAHTH